MKRILASVLFVALLTACNKPLPPATEAQKETLYSPKEGDILFQSLPYNPLTIAIAGVSSSPLSHCGIVTRANGDWMVLEAIGPVKETPLDIWISRGRSSYFSAFRILPPHEGAIPNFISSARSYLGRPYDILYELDDEKIYCSELIYKAFKAATGKPLGQAKPLGELNWKPHEDFIRHVTGGQLPLERIIILPVALSEAPELQKVYEKQ